MSKRSELFVFCSGRGGPSESETNFRRQEGWFTIQGRQIDTDLRGVSCPKYPRIGITNRRELVQRQVVSGTSFYSGSYLVL